MITTIQNTTKTLIEKALSKSMTYDDYINLVNELVQKTSNSGHEKTETLAHYTKLNQSRMRRWDKTVEISEKQKLSIKSYNNKVTWLVLTESWCGDAAHIIPVIQKVATLNANIYFKIALRDDNDSLMQHFLTNGGKAIPKLIMIDSSTKKVINTYGPRPSVATKMVNEFKLKHGTLTSKFKEDLQRWYNSDKGQSTLKDLVALLQG